MAVSFNDIVSVMQANPDVFSKATPQAGAIPRADDSGLLASWVVPSGSTNRVVYGTATGVTATSGFTFDAAIPLVTTAGDVAVSDATKGIILKSANGHYWRGTVNNSGVLSFADIGTSLPQAA